MHKIDSQLIVHAKFQKYPRQFFVFKIIHSGKILFCGKTNFYSHYDMTKNHHPSTCIFISGPLCDELLLTSQPQQVGFEN